VIFPCEHFDPEYRQSRGCRIHRPLSGQYCLHQCAAYAPVGASDQLYATWMEALNLNRGERNDASTSEIDNESDCPRD